MTQEEFFKRYSYDVAEDRIGGGGFGTVYKVYDNTLHRDVAIKVAEVKTVNGKTFSLRDEIEALSGLPEHSNIANYEKDKLFTFKTPQGIFDYAVMQYYPDGNLTNAIKAGLTDEQKEDIATQLLEGIAFLHEHKVVHRDLKPGNILIVKHGRKVIPLITDFGLSKAADTGDGSVFSNSLGAGTPKYSSPEQLQGKPLRLNTDLWSFGAIVYELFTGEQLFSAGSGAANSTLIDLEIYNKIVRGEVQSLAGMPEKWRHVAELCLVVDADKRAKNAGELLRNMPQATSSGPKEIDDDTVFDFGIQNQNSTSSLQQSDNTDEETVCGTEISSSLDYVDLGLSVKWATCNLGANKPEDTGMHYAWGETMDKIDYSEETYQFSDRRGKSYLKYCTKSKFGKVDNLDSLELADDAAHVALGSHWRMPTQAEIDELMNHCQCELVKLNGVVGNLMTSKQNGTSVFFPVGRMLMGEGGMNMSSYWSNALDVESPDRAVALSFIGANMNRGQVPRWAGGFIRPVYDEKIDGSDTPKMPLSHNDKNDKQEQDDVLVFDLNGQKIEMVKVKGGTFWMGAHSKMIKEGGLFGSKRPDNSIPNFNRYAQKHESPVHQVTLDDFYIAKYEFTQALWFAVTGRAPYAGPDSFMGMGPNYPLYSVSWNEFQLIVKRLNELFAQRLNGKRFRLPTEAEWEYAARGGHKSMGYEYSGSNNLDEVAWINSDVFHPVGMKRPNELGLYDMNGNIYEFCNDWYGDYTESPQTNPQGPAFGKEKVFRGGCAFCDSKLSYQTLRGGYKPDKIEACGFRLALS